MSGNDEIAMKALRASLEAVSSENNLSVTSFDTGDIPIRDNSFRFITSSRGLSSSKDGIWHPNETDMFCSSAGKEKAIHELYRILEPGGCLVALEKNYECDYDPIKLYSEFLTYGKLFGIYTYDEIRDVCNKLREESWREKFENEGFTVEKEEKFLNLCAPDSVMSFLYCFTKQHGIHGFKAENPKDEWDNLSSIPLPAHEGFDLFDTKTFLLLRKPY